MMPLFAHPAGLWVLLGIPAILAIHFLQQRARVARTSTWFLIEKLAPDSARGRTWDRLRSSRTLWLQLAAVLLAAWVLGEPRWVRAESAQTVVVVFDASASLDAFRAPAIAAAERELAAADRLAARTTWIVMTTSPRQPPLYRGNERELARTALNEWRPELGQHDSGPALRLARTLAGAAGRTLLITEARHKVPADQRAVGVGQPIENVGFAGATVIREESGWVWRALVKNHAKTAQQRAWQVQAGSTPAPAQKLALAPGALTEISGPLSGAGQQVVVVLEADRFATDDRLPLLAPQPKPLTVAIEGSDGAADFLRQAVSAIDGVTVSGANPQPVLRLAQLPASDVAAEPRGGIFWPPPARRTQAPLLNEPVTPDRHALVAGLTWQGWFGTGPYGFASGPADTPLLWHGRWPLVFLRPPPAGPAPTTGAASPKLMLAFDWATSNGSRLPAMVLLVRRFIETEQAAQRAPYAANFDAGAAVSLSGLPADLPLAVTFHGVENAAAPPIVRAIPSAEREDFRAPSRPGFFTVGMGNEILVRGSTHFSDPRQGSFEHAETFTADVRSERTAALERNTTGDPFVVLWLALLAAIMGWSWWTRRTSAAAGDPKTPREPRGRKVAEAAPAQTAGVRA